MKALERVVQWERERIAAERKASSTKHLVNEDVLIYKVDQGRRNEVWLWGRLKRDNSKVILKMIDHYPFFFAKMGDVPAHPSIVDVKHGYHSIFGQDLMQVVVKSPYDVRELRPHFEDVHEADVPYTQRVIIDTECLGWCKVTAAHVRDNEYVTTPGKIAHVSNEVDTNLLEIVYYDIEVAAEGGHMPGEDGQARDPIIAITIYDKARDEWIVWAYHPLVDLPDTMEVAFKRIGTRPVEVRHYKEERAMLASFCRWMNTRRPDVIAGWYSNGFDAPYIISRLENIGLGKSSLGTKGFVKLGSFGDDDGPKIPPDIPGVQCLDLIDTHKKMKFGTLKSASLKVAAEEIGIELEKNPGNITRWWKEDLYSLIEYNVRDVEATWLIDEEKTYSAFALSFMFFVFADHVADIFSASIVHDVNIMRRTRAQHIALPLKPAKSERGGKKFTGAVVQTPEPGIHENVLTLDFSSLYPTCAVAGNMSVDTLCTDETCPEDHFVAPEVGHKFHVDANGLIVDYFLYLWDLKKKYDVLKKGAKNDAEKIRVERLRWPVKIMLNALYGVIGYQGFRIHRREVAESVTALGREVITAVVDAARAMGYRIVYGDTDSLAVVALTDNLLEEGERLSEKLEEVAQATAREYGSVRPELFSLEFEKAFGRLLVADVKKKYAGTIVVSDGKVREKPYVDITGFETQRADAPLLTVEMQKRVFERLLVDMDDVEDVVKEVDIIYDQVRKGEVSIWEVSPSPEIKKRLDDYVDGYHASEAAKYSNRVLGSNIRQGDRINVIRVCRVPHGVPVTNSLAVVDDGFNRLENPLPDGFVIDWDEHARIAVRDKMDTILNALGYTRKVGEKTVQTKLALTDYM